jgi:hypothetical protein
LFFVSVIPLEDLPELQVGCGFGLVDKEHVKKPTFLKVTMSQQFSENCNFTPFFSLAISRPTRHFGLNNHIVFFFLRTSS